MRKKVVGLVGLVLAVLLVGGCMPGDAVPGTSYWDNLYPSNNLTASLGAPGYYWDEIYVRSVVSDSITGSITETDPVFGGSSAFGITAGDIAGWTAHPPLTTGTHGVTGTIVGTSDVQSLTHKEITMDSNEPIYWGDGAGGTVEVISFWNWLDILAGESEDIIVWLGSGTGQKLVLWPDASTVVSTAKDSPTLDFNANYWDGVNKNWEATIIHDMETAGAAPKSRLEFDINGVDILQLENSNGTVGTYCYGSLQTGGAASYSTFDSDGTLTMTGNARIEKDLWIEAGGIKAPGAKPATEVAHGTMETLAWSFADQGLVANQESVSLRTPVPNDIDMSVPPYVVLGWSSTTVDPGDDSEQVKWQLEYLWLAEDEDTTAGPGGTVTVTSSTSTTSEGLVLSTFPNLSTPGGGDATIQFKLTRLSADGADTVSDSVELHGFCFRYTADKLGS